MFPTKSEEILIFVSSAEPHIFWRVERIRNLEFELPPLRLLSPHYFLGSLDEDRAIAIILHYHRLRNFFHHPKGKCIVITCRLDPATTPPPISYRQLVRLSPHHRRSTREESKRPLALLCRLTGIKW